MIDEKERNVEIGKRIRTARKKAGMSQRELAAQLDVVPMTVSAYELGKITLSVNQISRISSILGCRREDLLPPDKNADTEKNVPGSDFPDQHVGSIDSLDMAMHIRDSVLLQNVFARAVKADEDTLKAVIDILDILNRRKPDPAPQAPQDTQDQQ